MASCRTQESKKKARRSTSGSDDGIRRRASPVKNFNFRIIRCPDFESAAIFLIHCTVSRL